MGESPLGGGGRRAVQGPKKTRCFLGGHEGEGESAARRDIIRSNDKTARIGWFFRKLP